MKKMFALFLSLLFVVTSFNSVSGFCDPEENVCSWACILCLMDPCTPGIEYCNIYAPPVVQAGDIIQVEIKGQGCEVYSEADFYCGHAELMDVKVDFEEGDSGCIVKAVYTFRALSPGVVGAKFLCNENKKAARSNASWRLPNLAL